MFEMMIIITMTTATAMTPISHISIYASYFLNGTMKAVAPFISLTVQMSPALNVWFSSVAAVHSSPLILIAPFCISDTAWVTTAFSPMIASEFIRIFFEDSFFFRIGRVKTKSSMEITAKSTICSQSGHFMIAAKIIRKEPAANHIVVRPLVRHSMTINITVKPSQIHGIIDKLNMF